RLRPATAGIRPAEETPQGPPERRGPRLPRPDRCGPDVSDSPFDVAVVGAGAAGLMAAISAAEAGARVLLLEKTARTGIKILMSGGTRCNITHATDNKGIVAAYGPPGRFLHSALAAFSVQDAID